MKVGDMVVCINNNHRLEELTVGKVYVIDQMTDSSFICIKDNFGDYFEYRRIRFELHISVVRRNKLERLAVVSSRNGV